MIQRGHSLSIYKVSEGMIGGGEEMRGSNALLSGSDQIWLVLFVYAQRH